MKVTAPAGIRTPVAVVHDADSRRAVLGAFMEIL
jgi:hypothetical protein